MVIIGKYIEGISLNGLEYLLNEDNTEMEFDTIDNAKIFLIENGYTMTDEELDDNFIFEQKD